MRGTLALTRRHRDPTDAEPLPSIRRHAVFGVLVLLGVALRVIVSLAYRPVLLYPDSLAYLYNVTHLGPRSQRPTGYPLLLRPLLAAHDLTVVAVVQHVFGLAIAVIIYAVALRRGVRRWLAALATAPVLLDAYQLSAEHYVLSDAMFELMLAGAVAVLLWPRGRRSGRPAEPLGVGRCVVAALLLALSVWVRSTGLLLTVPALGYLLLRSDGRGLRLRRAGAFVVAVAAPLLGYAAWTQATDGAFAINQFTGRLLYGRVAPFVDCGRMRVPPIERGLCPTLPRAQRHTTDEYTWASWSPAVIYSDRYGARSDGILRDFALRAIRNQPGDYLDSVAADLRHTFALTHTPRPADVSEAYARFTDESPSPVAGSGPVLRRYGGGPARVNAGLASFLGSYQRVGYLPGTLLLPLIALCPAAVATAAVRQRRAARPPPPSAAESPGARPARHDGPEARGGQRSGLETAFVAAMALTAVLPGYLITEFVWRYQLPMDILLPLAGALAIGTLGPGPTRGVRGRADSAALARSTSVAYDLTAERDSVPRSVRTVPDK